MTTTATAPDLAAIKQRQQATWASGDYHMIGTQILIVSELLIETLDVHSTERVLDVATGSGNAALAAARRGCEVVGIDYVPALLDRARRRAEAEGRRGRRSSRATPRPCRSTTAASTSSARCSVRCSRRTRSGPRASCPRLPPGGRIGLVAHTPDGFIGKLFKTNGKHVPPPAGLRSPIQWGTEERLGSSSATPSPRSAVEKRHYVFRYQSPAGLRRVLAPYYGPTLKAFEAVGDAGREALEADILDLIARFNRADEAWASAQDMELFQVVDSATTIE